MKTSLSPPTGQDHQEDKEEGVQVSPGPSAREPGLHDSEVRAGAAGRAPQLQAVVREAEKTPRSGPDAERSAYPSF